LTITTTTIKPYKKIGNISLYLKDCTTGMNEVLPTEYVDVVVTSPPYNIGINYHRYKDKIPKVTILESRLIYYDARSIQT
jgi:DNA modification methylase